jgi:hypothetical protein
VPVKSRSGHFVLAVFVVLGAGLLANGVVRPARVAVQPAAKANVRTLAWAWLGDLRPVGASLAWLQLQGAWQQRNPAETMAWIRLATELEPRSLFFWANGARIIAHDMADWLSVTGRSRQAVGHDQAAMALTLLNEAQAWHEQNPHYWIERAGIELHAAQDTVAAAASFRQAAKLPGAPYFAARLHAELLVRQGRFDAAREWLVELHPTLPARDPRAQVELVLGRIRALEERLSLPAEQRYRPWDEL